jgi:hypothetical protein
VLEEIVVRAPRSEGRGAPRVSAVRIPPAFSTEAADLYIGYFENRNGEPWIFTCHRAMREASLRGGDAGWARAHPVRDGQVDGLILAPEQAAWPRRAGVPRERSRLLNGHGARRSGRPRADLAGRCGRGRAGSRHTRFAVPSLAVACAVIASRRWAAASCPPLNARRRIATSAVSSSV